MVLLDYIRLERYYVTVAYRASGMYHGRNWVLGEVI